MFKFYVEKFLECFKSDSFPQTGKDVGGARQANTSVDKD